MLKALRKYRQWILVIGGALLMLAFLAGPTIQQLGGDPLARKWATLDGRTLRERDRTLAAQELKALEAVTFGMWPAQLGVDRGQRDVKHWLLLTHEARQGGFLAEAQEPEWLPEMLGQARFFAQYRQMGIDIGAFIRNNPGMASQFTSQLQGYIEEARTAAPEFIARIANDNQMTPDQLRGALSKGRGVQRMYEAYIGAARVSDRLTVREGRRLLDSAWVDYVFVPASVGVKAVPEPDETALAAHFDRFKGTKPGEGDFGIGYLLPDRVKLEWLALDAPAIEAAVMVDPIELNQKYLRERSTYTGDFAAERARVEQDLKTERVARAMDEAHKVIQAEVLRVTRRLEADGRFKKLPSDWTQARPKFEVIATKVVEGVKAATGLTIPLPTVEIRAADWVTAADLAAIPGLGQSSLRSGAVEQAVGTVLFQVRELQKAEADDTGSAVAIQAGMPLIESYFTDSRRSRYYVTVLEARRESAPDSHAEIATRVMEDYKRLKSYEQLAGRVEEFRSLAVGGGAEGLQKVVDLTKPADAPATEDVSMAPAPALRTRVQVRRENAEGFAPDQADFNTKPVREAIMDAAGRLDPLTPPDKLEAEAATIAVAVPERLGVVVARIVALQPLTREMYRMSEPSLAMRHRQDELGVEAEKEAPFTVDRLLARHEFIVRQGAEEEEDETDPAPAKQAASTGG